VSNLEIWTAFVQQLSANSLAFLKGKGREKAMPEIRCSAFRPDHIHPRLCNAGTGVG
jgi:hypothetical protein